MKKSGYRILDIFLTTCFFFMLFPVSVLAQGSPLVDLPKGSLRGLGRAPNKGQQRFYRKIRGFLHGRLKNRRVFAGLGPGVVQKYVFYAVFMAWAP